MRQATALVLASTLGASAAADSILPLNAEQMAALDEAYAPTLFEGLVQFDAVLASRRFDTGDSAIGCSYAVVSLDDAAPADPPSRPASDELGPAFAFGGAWWPTPMPRDPAAEDLIALCQAGWGRDVEPRLRDALAEPGSWVSLDRSWWGWLGLGGAPDALHLYSAPQRIAARIGLGD